MIVSDTLEGDRVVRESNGTDTIWYYYDAGGSVTGFELNGVTYYYVKNIQGDIVAIVDETGAKVVEYTYDSWGKLISTTGTLVNTVGEKNPYRYRGYRYDAETGLYYLNSRYYDPEIGRFINADGYVSTGQSVTGHNMFVYCGNNPIIRSDPSGKFFKTVGAAIHAFAGNLLKKIANQIVQSTVFAVNFAVDIKNFDFTNTDEEKVANANYISFYKGHLAIKHPFEDLSSCSYAGIMFINQNINKQTLDNRINTVRHEYGHCRQYDRMVAKHGLVNGTLRYTVCAFLPSVACYWLNVPDEYYYSMSWDYEADLLGGTQTPDYYQDWADDVYFWYRLFT